MKNIVRQIAFAACLAISACSSTPKSKTSPIKEEVLPFLGGQKVHRYEFKNGLRLLVLQDKTSPTFAYQTWFRVGSRDEDVKYTGLAHLFEHMMFKATKNLKDGEFDRILEASGGESMNASTSRDFTDYVQELPKEHLDLIAKMEADRMVNLVVDDQQFKTEREVVQNERRYRNENSPDGLMYQEIYQQAYKAHSYRWPVIGYEEDLNRMTAQDAYAFYKKHYAPNSATIVVVGDVEPSDVVEKVTKYYGDLPSVELKPNPRTPEPEQKAAITKRMKLNIQVEKLMVGFKAPAFSHPDIPALMLVRSALSNGKSSRLYKALVETGVASSVAAYDIDDEDPSLFIIHVNLQKGKKASDAQRIINETIRKFQNELMDAKELERSKNQLSYEIYEAINDGMERASFLGHMETILPNFTVGMKTYEQVPMVTAEQARDVARKYLQTKNMTSIIGEKK